VDFDLESVEWLLKPKSLLAKIWQSSLVAKSSCSKEFKKEKSGNLFEFFGT
jgi:hypothetical protein